MVVDEVSTKTAHTGDKVVLRVDEAVIIGGVVVIPIGCPARGEVVTAEQSGVVGRFGKLSAKLLYVEAPGGRVALRGDADNHGANGTAETVMGVIGLGPLGLLARGNNAKLKAGDILNGYVARDLPFDIMTHSIVAVSPIVTPAVAERP